MKIYEFLSELHSLSGIPILYVDCPTFFVRCYFGKINLLKFNETSIRKVGELVEDKEIVVLKDKENSENEMSLVPVKGNNQLNGLIFFVKNQHNSYACDYKYKHTVNLLSLFLYGSSAISEEQTEAMEYFDPELWNLFYSAPSDEAYTYLTYFIEKRILQSIRQGNLYTLREEISLYLPLAMSTLYLPSIPFGQKRNLMISAVTMAFVDASGGGLPAKEGFELLRKYHNIIENLTSFENIEPLIAEIFTTFCKKVLNAIQKNYSKPVAMAIEHVKSHLKEKIRLGDIAQRCNMRISHLSALFKHEYGINFSTFVMNEKIEEAKKLIQYSDYPISAIASELGFTDQSHFSRCFKKNTGYTPSKFRKMCSESNHFFL